MIRLIIAVMLVIGSAGARGDGSTCPMILSPMPEPSGSIDYRGQQLDRLEARLYDDARSGRIRWIQLVDQFYIKCTELYPGFHTTHLVEVSAYQRVLAEQMDNRRITESEWVYLLEKQAAEIRAREQVINNSRPINQNASPFGTNCTTKDIGLPGSPMYRTHCD